MKSCQFQRARSPQQKAERRAHILLAAADFFSRQRFESIALTDIARQAGVTKAALYRYFPSKEALFLELYLNELEALAEGELNKALPLWEALADVLVSRSLFCRLTAILHSVLEQNLDVGQARTFKLTLLQHFAVLGQRLQEHSPFPPDKIGGFLLQVQQAIIGCWAVSHPAPGINKLLNAPPLDVFRVEFADALRAQLKALEAASR